MIIINCGKVPTASQPQNKAEMSYLRNSPQTDRDTAGGTVFPIASDYSPETRLGGYNATTERDLPDSASDSTSLGWQRLGFGEIYDQRL
jgi:hypothetical protein